MRKHGQSLPCLGYDKKSTGSTREIRKQYIGQEDGNDYYKNLANKYFPTIAPSLDIRGLRKISEIDEMNILWLSKAYYVSLARNLKTMSKSLVLMSDSNGVPFEDWRQTHVNFHGYSTCYENAKNENILDPIAKKIYEIDGPWSYSEMQRIMYFFANDILSGGALSSDLLDEELGRLASTIDFMSDETSKKEITSLYKKNLSNGWIVTTALTKSISCNETDIFDNTYVLLKSDLDSIEGEVLFRSYDMLVGLPLVDMLEADPTAIGKLKSIASHCCFIGAVNDIVWMYGLDGSKYSLVMAQVKLERNKLEVVSFTDFPWLDFSSLNDFVCCLYQPEKNTFKIFTFDSVEELLKLSSIGQLSALFDYDLSLTMTEIDASDFSSYVLSNVKRSHTMFPCILKHPEAHENVSFENSHSIWKAEEFKDSINIAYEALNSLNKEEFEYYLNFTSDNYLFEVRTFTNEMYTIFTDKTINQLTQNVVLSSAIEKDFVTLSLPSIISDEKAIERLGEFILEFPKCTLKKNSVVSTLSFFNGAKKLKEKDENSFWEFTKKVWRWMQERKEFNRTDHDLQLAREMLAEDRELYGELKQLIDDYGVDGKNYIFMKSFLNAGGFSFIKSTGDKTIDDIKTNGKKEVEWISSFDLSKAIVQQFDSLDDGSSISLNDLYKNAPSILTCMSDTLKIVIYFKNTTGVTFINDYALDADVSCYIDDVEEKKTRVGYWAGFKKTKYIQWSGDRTKGSLEWLEINPYLYFNNNPALLTKTMKIVLNVCWHDESEIMYDEIYAILSFNRNMPED